jgi:hypothetical protein
MDTQDLQDVGRFLKRTAAFLVAATEILDQDERVKTSEGLSISDEGYGKSEFCAGIYIEAKGRKPKVAVWMGLWAGPDPFLGSGGPPLWIEDLSKDSLFSKRLQDEFNPAPAHAANGRIGLEWTFDTEIAAHDAGAAIGQRLLKCFAFDATT